MKAIWSMLAITLLAGATQFPGYQPVPKSDVAGELRCVGSSTVGVLLEATQAKFGKLYPELSIEIVSGGSGTAPPALLDGSADLAPMSRPMKAAERAAFVDNFGYEPTEISVALDAVAVYVNVDNPVTGLSFDQLDAILSSTASRSGRLADTWGDVGVTDVAWADMPIERFGLDTQYAASSILQKQVLEGGDFRADLRLQYGSSQVVQEVGAVPGAIGFTSLTFATERARPLALAEVGEPVLPNGETVIDGTYPLSRRLYIYVNKKPGEPIPAAARELLLFLLSADGQRAVAEAGYLQLSVELAAEMRELVE